MLTNMQTLKVKNGSIVLPPKLRAAWKNAELQILEYGNKILLEGPATPRKKIDMKAWEQARGIWKHRRIPDPIVWQRKIRQEWERKLP